MKTMLRIYVSALLLMASIGVARADVFKGAPVQAVLLPVDGSDLVKVAFLFDLSSLRAGENRHIEEALLDWKLTGLSEQDVMDFTVYPVVETWTNASVQSGHAPVAGAPVAEWRIGPTMRTADGAKLARLDLTDMVRSWTAGTSANYGVVVASSALNRASVDGQFQNARLVVRYGFRDN